VLPPAVSSGPSGSSDIGSPLSGSTLGIYVPLLRLTVVLLLPPWIAGGNAGRKVDHGR
jgi:hypothetical protein